MPFLAVLANFGHATWTWTLGESERSEKARGSGQGSAESVKVVSLGAH
jgi:hypothetical protein